MKTRILLGTVLATAILSAMPSLAQSPDALPSGDAAPVMVIDTPTFLRVAVPSNAFEIQSSQLAKDKGVEGHVLELADMIIADHIEAGEKLGQLTEKQGLEEPPEELAPKQQRMLEQLEAAEGDDFTTLYLDIQAQAHMEAVALFRTYAGSGDNQAIVGFARQTVPKLENHLHHVKMLIVEQAP
jgi:putative membrane protein